MVGLSEVLSFKSKRILTSLLHAHQDSHGFLGGFEAIWVDLSHVEENVRHFLGRLLGVPSAVGEPDESLIPIIGLQDSRK